MVVIIKDNKLVMITAHKTIHFYLPKDVDNNFKQKTNFIINHKELLAEQTIKSKISQI